MKNLFKLLVLFCCFTLKVGGQSKVFTYANLGTYGGRTITYLPNGLYAATESFTAPSYGGVHFTVYDQVGNILIDKQIDIADHESLGNVDVEYVNTDQGDRIAVLMAKWAKNDHNSFNYVLLVTDFSGNIQWVEVKSPDPIYENLHALDLEYDENQQTFLICGSALADNSCTYPCSVPYPPSLKKIAFLTKIDANLNVVGMQFYNSNAGLGNDDYDIATRVKVTQNGNYYLMGSENMDKGLNAHIAGIRNMLVNATTLNTIWSNPVHMNRNSSMENSVDMLEVQTNNGTEFIVLVNSTDVDDDFLPFWFYLTAKWWVHRIDPSNGTALYNNFETLFPNTYSQLTLYSPNLINFCFDIGHSLHHGNNAGEVIVSGLKFPTDNRRCHTMNSYTFGNGQPSADAVPFMATLDLANYPTTVNDHVEYNSILQGGYWGFGTGGVYDNLPYNVYNLVNYLPRFVDREQAGSPYGMLAPVGGAITTKYLDINSTTGNGCDDVRCNYVINESAMLPVYPNIDLDEYSINPLTYIPDIWVSDISPISVDDCSSGIYKPTSSLQKNPSKKELRIYPNPTSDFINIDYPEGYSRESFSVILTDLAGKKIADFSNDPIENNRSKILLPQHLSDGVYFLVIKSGTIYKNHKIVLSR